ncbi:MAG: ABC transporter substrate-binding protein [Propionibacteriaceae bacterium]|jgi:branched-chain amino acid transport system substrate-binding protein|nr:ABC transporter substrate-binding protein [Propionibacteriaceae bacterium]
MSGRRPGETGRPAGATGRWLHRLAAATLGLGLVVALTACAEAAGSAATGSPAADQPVRFGVSAPVTGQNAEYGRLWKQGFDLALKQLNADGGVDGRPVELVWEDSQSDPKQTVPIAQKFADDATIIAELGDFSSNASMAASPVYQRAGLVQFGFTNSSPDFTTGGDHMWSTSLTQTYLQDFNAGVVAQYAQSVAVIYLQTDWGKVSFDSFSAGAASRGLEIVYSSAFQADATDLTPILIKARDAHPDAIVHLGYGPDGALAVNQLRDKVGWTGPFFGGQNTPEFLSLAGANGEGDIIPGAFVVTNPDPAVQAFVQAFQDEYGQDPGDFNLYAYDALDLLVQAARAGGPTREGIFQALSDPGATWQSVQFGAFQFDQQTRRPNDAKQLELIDRDGRFVVNS